MCWYSCNRCGSALQRTAIFISASAKGSHEYSHREARKDSETYRSRGTNVLITEHQPATKKGMFLIGMPSRLPNNYNARTISTNATVSSLAGGGWRREVKQLSFFVALAGNKGVQARTLVWGKFCKGWINSGWGCQKKRGDSTNEARELAKTALLSASQMGPHL
jgi:hypothetical protein